MLLSTFPNVCYTIHTRVNKNHKLFVSSSVVHGKVQMLPVLQINAQTVSQLM